MSARLRLSAVAACVLLAAGVAHSSEPKIGGVYCGEAESGGEMVEVRTRLDVAPSGLISGSYLFADKGETTPGDIAQYVAGVGPTRTLVWRDRYGSGLARFTFDAEGDSFVGAWGVDLEEPTRPWNGRRCDMPLV